MVDDTAALGGAVPAARQAHSYRDILKSSAIIGGSSAINVAIGIVRTKAMAVLLGPSGYGLMGAYLLIAELTRNLAQLGINASGVRQIAEAQASGDGARIARTVAVLRRTSLACAVLGAVMLAVLSAPVARLTFGDDRHAGAVALLSLAVFFSLVAGGQGALLQGMRRIGDLARLSVLGGVLGTLVAVALVHAFGPAGLVPALVIAAACSVVASWWYSRRITVAAPQMRAREIAANAGALLKLGLAFMASGLLTAGAAYAVRIVVLRQVGVEAAGIYHAAWTLGGLYIGFVLQALGTDFYPRLVGAARDNAQCNRLVNEQAQVSLLLAIPGVLATLTFASIAVSLFYSPSFAGAAGVLRWICLGMALRVLTWPIGYIVVAKNRQALFFTLELAWTLVNIGLTWWCVEAFGVEGAGIAFFGSYVFHALLMYPVVRRLSGFRWSRANRHAALGSLAAIALVFIGFQALPPALAVLLGVLSTAASGYVAARRLMQLVSPQRLPRPVAWILQWRKLSP